MKVNLAVSLLLFTSSGCSFIAAAGDPNLKTVKVSGEVKVDGQSAPLLVIEFHPEPGTSKIERAVAAVTDEQGKFNVKMPEGNVGLPPGNYFVVFKWLSIGGNRQDRLKGAYSDAYNDPTRSTFKVTVNQGQPNDLGTFELSTKKPKGRS